MTLLDKSMDGQDLNVKCEVREMKPVSEGCLSLRNISYLCDALVVDASVSANVQTWVLYKRRTASLLAVTHLDTVSTLIQHTQTTSPLQLLTAHFCSFKSSLLLTAFSLH